MTFNEFFKRFLAVLAVLLLCLGFGAARSTLLFGFAAAVIAVGLSIPARWLQRRGLRHGWSVPIATVGAGLVVLLLFFLVVPRLVTSVIELLSTVRPDIILSKFIDDNDFYHCLSSHNYHLCPS